MRSRSIKAALATVGVVAAAGVMPLVTATPAGAAQSTCVNYVGNKGYLVGPKVRSACSRGAIDMGVGKVPNPVCTTRLLQAGVDGNVATSACLRA
ncbi:putative secreted protein [Streptomyces ambofaciens ATCC 23877]|uniref:Putative secreted protein n=1 Tax=Streptomyces ambofaciens (strain ATCC 23877 / 3486 / DSM 40053 / JCM 4204 / NBRC 12836 / NRRL B-2516) TaxID=278992 RepID=A0A0K2ART8_STRA7|nr:putative secreted protein [Streptomyces ambofaciens ATCC 23877]